VDIYIGVGNKNCMQKRAEKIILRGVGYEDIMSLCISDLEYSVTKICVKHVR
jgi:hypothetical protein